MLLLTFSAVNSVLLLTNYTCMQLYERREKFAKGQEVRVIQSLNEKFMSDEETDMDDPDSFVKYFLKWRSTECNQLFKKLDQRYMDTRERKVNSKPLKKRKIGSFSDRGPPKNAPTHSK